MPPGVPKPPYTRFSLYLTAEAAQRLRTLADQTEEGNVSRLIRRLIAEESDRRTNTKEHAA